MATLNLKFIRQRRNEMGFSLQHMAEQMGLKHASSYMKYERGEYEFKANQLPILAEKLECTIQDFFKHEFAESANGHKASA